MLVPNCANPCTRGRHARGRRAEGDRQGREGDDRALHKHAAEGRNLRVLLQMEAAPISIAIDALGPDRFNLRVGGQLFTDTRVK